MDILLNKDTLPHKHTDLNSQHKLISKTCQLKILVISESCRCYEIQPTGIHLINNTECDKTLQGLFPKMSNNRI